MLDTLLDNTVEDETAFPGLDTDVSLSFASSRFALLFFSSDCKMAHFGVLNHLATDFLCN